MTASVFLVIILFIATADALPREQSVAQYQSSMDSKRSTIRNFNASSPGTFTSIVQTPPNTNDTEGIPDNQVSCYAIDRYDLISLDDCKPNFDLMLAYQPDVSLLFDRRIKWTAPPCQIEFIPTVRQRLLVITRRRIVELGYYVLGKCNTYHKGGFYMPSTAPEDTFEVSFSGGDLIDEDDGNFIDMTNTMSWAPQVSGGAAGTS